MPGTSQGQTGPVMTPPVRWEHPLNRGLAAWWMAVPHAMWGNRLYNLCPWGNPGVLTSMTGTGQGRRVTNRPGGWGHTVFDGTAGDVEVAPHPTLELSARSWSVSLWFRPAISDLMGLVSKIDSVGGYQFGLWSRSTRFDLSVYDNGVGFVNPFVNTGATVGAWNFGWARYTNSSKLAEVCLNNVFSTTASATLTVGLAAQGSAAIKVNNNDSGYNYFNGAIDDIRIWTDRALTNQAFLEVERDARLGYPGTIRRHSRARYAGVQAAAGFKAAWARRANTLIGGGTT